MVRRLGTPEWRGLHERHSHLVAKMFSVDPPALSEYDEEKLRRTRKRMDAIEMKFHRKHLRRLAIRSPWL